MRCCPNQNTGGHGWRRHAAGLTVCLLGPTRRQRREQGIPGVEREAPGHGGCWCGPRWGAVPHLRSGRWPSGPEPHEIQQIQQRHVQGCRGSRRTQKMLNTAYLFDAPWENGRGFRRFDPLWHAQARRRVKRKKTLQVKAKIQSTCHIFTRP